MEDENNQNGHKKLIPPPYKIKILTAPPYRINLSQDDKNEDGTDTQHNSNFVQAQVNEESNKLATTQNPVSTPSARNFTIETRSQLPATANGTTKFF